MKNNWLIGLLVFASSLLLTYISPQQSQNRDNSLVSRANESKVVASPEDLVVDGFDARRAGSIDLSPVLPEKENKANAEEVEEDIMDGLLKDILKELEKVETNIDLPVPSVVVPTLPSVKKEELLIDNNIGIKNVTEYFTYLIDNRNNITFDYGRMIDLVERYKGSLPMPPVIISSFLQGNTNREVAIQDAKLLKDFFVAKEEYEQKIKVTESGALVAERVIGIDRLTISLLENFENFATGKLEKSAFDKLHKTYEETVKFYSGEFLSEAGALARKSEPENLITKIVHFFLRPILAQAIAPVIPFGGKVVSNIPCTCPATFGMAMGVSIPRPGIFFVFPVVALYAYYAPISGNWVLGIAAPAPVPCLQFIPPTPITPPLCTFVPAPPTEGPVIMMGTSATP